MTELEKLFASNTDEDRREDAIENLVLSVQIALQKSMHRSCVSQRELADRMGVSAARVSQILCGDQSNLTLKTIGKIAHALGEDFELISKSSLKRSQVAQQSDYSQIISVKKAPRNDPWKDKTANLNGSPDLMAA